MRIKRFKLKDYVTLDGIQKRYSCLEDGGVYVQKDSVKCMFKTLHGDISATIAFPEDLSKWNDFDYILVLDEEGGQPYFPFYGPNYGENIIGFPFLVKVIDAYNDWLSSLDFLEEVNPDGM